MTDISRRKFLGGVGATGVGLAAAACVPKTPPAPTLPRQDDSIILNGPATTNVGGGSGGGGNPAGGGAPYVSPLLGSNVRPLVYVSLFGGNDGLNTIIPYTDPVYLAARGNIALKENNGIIPIGEGHAMHPSLAAFKAKVWDTNKLAIIRSVGSLTPDRSHFRATDVWHTGRPDMLTPTGWGGLWLDTTGDDLSAVAMSNSLPRFLRGAHSSAITIGGTKIGMDVPAPQRLSYRKLAEAEGSDPYWAAAWRKSGSDLTRAEDLFGSVINAPLPAGSQLAGLTTPIAADLARVLRLLAIPGNPTRVFYVGLANFDTHTNQLNTHATLLKALGDALGAFQHDLGLIAGGDNVTTLVASEFGRRLNSNAGNGTDHGTANTAFLMGSRVNAGFHGSPMNLSNLDPIGDPIANFDLRSLIATVLARQLATDPTPILGSAFPHINVLAA